MENCVGLPFSLLFGFVLSLDLSGFRGQLSFKPSENIGSSSGAQPRSINFAIGDSLLSVYGLNSLLPSPFAHHMLRKFRHLLPGSKKRKGYGTLSADMGNSESVCKRHYVEVLKPAHCAAWFGIHRHPLWHLPREYRRGPRRVDQSIGSATCGLAAIFQFRQGLDT